MQRISSRATFFSARLFPVAWIVLFGLGTRAMWFRPGDVVFNGVKGAATRADQLLFLGAWVVGSAFLLWFCYPLREVWLDGQQIVLRHFGHEERVPVAEILEVGTMWWTRPTMGRIRFRTPGGGVRTVRFLTPQGSVLFRRDSEEAGGMDALLRAIGRPSP